MQKRNDRNSQITRPNSKHESLNSNRKKSGNDKDNQAPSKALRVLNFLFFSYSNLFRISSFGFRASGSPGFVLPARPAHHNP
jgi:hypothetical protein